MPTLLVTGYYSQKIIDIMQSYEWGNRPKYNEFATKSRTNGRKIVEGRFKGDRTTELDVVGVAITKLHLMLSLRSIIVASIQIL